MKKTNDPYLSYIDLLHRIISDSCNAQNIRMSDLLNSKFGEAWSRTVEIVAESFPNFKNSLQNTDYEKYL